ncbi:MAG: aryl-sulfate sulfohydrolase [Verrucomicrobia bacterium 12-59-8]|nr:MAG: aryl-sulfate sulfohydrolase [Verrucomicrobia bacterium 12-59-8]
MKNLLICCLCFGGLVVTSTAAVKPNIIVIYTDDHGFADLGIRGVEPDVKTPHLDALARSGVIAKHGYSTAPQCVPSRGGLMTGKFQGRFNLDSNNSSLEGFDKETTIATRLQRSGYVTAQFGKWHLGPTMEIPTHGFTHSFAQHGQQKFSANITLEGKDKPMGDLPPEMYHVDGCAKAAASVIERYREQPFFLYVAFRAPHTPLDAPQSYKDRFPGPMPERRRAALGMLAAVDDGVGLITSTLKKNSLTEKTLIFFIGDNGAPLKILKTDSPLNGDAGGWDGSLNTPLNGEKGMLSEGGMHVPFLIAWPGTIPRGQTYEHPVSALDVAATAAALADIAVKPGDLDGVNLVPYLKGEITAPPHEALMWRWMAQSAIREGNWKLLRGGEREYLYDLSTDLEEKHNLASQHPEIAARLHTKLTAWCAELNPPGLALGPMAPVWNDYFDYYLEGKPAPKPESELDTGIRSWLARGGSLIDKEGILVLTPDKGGKGTFITHSRLKLTGPVTAKITFKTAAPGQGAIAWRVDGDKDFLPANRVPFEVKASDDWQTHEVQIPAKGRVIHVRVQLPPGAAQFRTLDFKSTAR